MFSLEEQDGREGGSTALLGSATGAAADENVSGEVNTRLAEGAVRGTQTRSAASVVGQGAGSRKEWK